MEVYPKPPTEFWRLCFICSRTLIGTHALYPDHTGNLEVRRTIAFCTNQILKALPKQIVMP